MSIRFNNCITDPCKTAGDYEHEQRLKQCRIKYYRHYHPMAHIFHEGYPSKDIKKLQSQILQVRYCLISDDKYNPEHHYKHLAKINHSISMDSKNVKAQNLRKLLPKLPNNFYRLQQFIREDCLNILTMILNQQIILISENQENKYSLLSPTMSSANINTNNALSLNGYLNLIKEWGSSRPILDSEFNKTVNYRMLLDRELNQGSISAKKLQKFDDLVGLLLFLNCLMLAELFPCIVNGRRYINESNYLYLGEAVFGNLKNYDFVGKSYNSTDANHTKIRVSPKIANNNTTKITINKNNQLLSVKSVPNLKIHQTQRTNHTVRSGSKSRPMIFDSSRSFYRKDKTPTIRKHIFDDYQALKPFMNEANIANNMGTYGRNKGAFKEEELITKHNIQHYLGNKWSEEQMRLPISRVPSHS